MIATVHARTMSDGSIGWDVDVRAEQQYLRFGCEDEASARKLAEALLAVSWIDDV